MIPTYLTKVARVKKAKNWIIGLTVVVLLALGVAALGNGFRSGEQAPPNATCGELDSDGDGIINCEDGDGSGQGAICGGGAKLANGQGRCGVRSLDGGGCGPQAGFGMRQGRGCGR